MKLYNTLSRSLEEIPHSEDGSVHMYNCGPTVYFVQHIGNLMAFTAWDVLTRALRYEGVEVKRVMNLTDVGHMTSDEDWGEDKMEVGAKREGITPIDIANRYTRIFFEDMKKMNNLFPNGQEISSDYPLDNLKAVNITRATEYIPQMIELIKKMEANGFTYETDQAVYFDISKYSEYSKLSGQILEENKVAVRDEVKIDEGKKHPADFVLWMKAVGLYETHAMKWESPWGVGFPGWHIECSAMGTSILGSEIDVHTGGIEHIGVHHPNERAQNYGVFEREIVKMWVHNEHLQSIKGEKLSKSKGNAYSLSDLIEKGYDPLDFRMFLVTNNYRVPLKFSFEALDNAKRSRISIISKLKSLKSERVGTVIESLKQEFVDALNNDLNVSVAFSVLNSVFKSTESPEDKIATVLDFDKVFGLNLSESLNENILDIPQGVLDMAQERVNAKIAKDFTKADEIRNEIDKLGYQVKDLPEGKFEVTRK